MKILIVILTTILSGLLYSYGGAKGTSLAWRRIGVPAIISIVMLTQQLWIPAALAWLLFPILTLGYGEDSWLRELLNGSNFWTRTVISFLIASVLALTTGSYYCFLFLPWYIGLTTKWKWDDVLIKGLLLEEILIGAGIGICSIL